MASKSTYYRNRLKRNDPGKYEEYLHQQATAAKRRRDQLKEDLSNDKPSKKSLALKKRQLEQHKMRQRKYSERRKQKEATNRNKRGNSVKVKLSFKSPKPSQSTNPIATRSSTEAKRAYWRERKQAERKRLHESRPQKLRRIREKDRERKRRQRANGVVPKQTPTVSKSPGYHSIHTMRNHTSKARRALPRSPNKFASVVSTIIKNASPRKQTAMKKQGLTTNNPQVQEIAEKIKQQKGGREALKRFACASIKYARKIQISKQFKLSRGTIRRALSDGGRRAVRRGKMSPMLRQQVKEFYLRNDVSRPLPMKRYATKHGPGRHMEMSLRAAHQMFEAEYPGAKVSYSQFARLRPKNVRLLSKVHHEVCTCVYCVNVKHKLHVINRAIDVTKSSNVKKIPDEFSFVDNLLCPKSDAQRFQNNQCLMGSCNKCGNYGERIRNMYADVIDASGALHTWLHWEMDEIRVSETSGGKSRRVLKTKQGQMEVLIEELVRDVERPVQGVSFVRHLFTARWQHRQFAHVKDSLPENWGLMIMDFGKNRRVFYQDEIKSAYYGQRQITMHPVVMYYNKSNFLVRESLIFLSDDILHDYHAVEHFLKMASDHLSKQMVGLKHEVIWSDGCQSQYKGRGTFADLSLSSVSRERNYFGSEHGKGEGDGEIGVVNKAVDRAILGRKVVINSARDMWQWCSDNLASDDACSKRRFVYVAPNEIQRSRPQTEVVTVKGSRSFHQIQVVGPYKLKTRRLSCFCASCLMGKEEICENTEYTGGKFQVKHLRLKKKQQNVTDVVQAAQTEQDPISSETTSGENDQPSETVGLEEDTGPSQANSGEKAASLLDGQHTLPEIEPGEFIAVKLHGRRGTCEWYLAKVLSVADDSMRLSYLVKSGTYYVWPTTDDESWQNKSDYLCHVQPRWAVTGSRIKMILDHSDITRILDAFSCKA